jgi:transposase
VRKLLRERPKGFAVVCVDESIFIHDAIVKRIWALIGTRPICLVTGSHQRTCAFGALSMDGRQFFRQYAAINEDTFLYYVKQLHRKFGRLCLFLDKSKPHYKSRKVRRYLRRNRSTIRVRWFPTSSPELNAMEECWRQVEKDLLTSRYYPSFPELKKALATYLRTKRFRLDMLKFLLTKEC